MDCPHCKVPFMKGMTRCPRCRYDINLPGGGELHQKWLEDHKEDEEKRQQQKIEEQRKAALSAQIAAQIEDAKKSMILSSCSSVEGYRATKQFGLVFGDCAYKTGFLKTISASLDNIADVLSIGDKELSGTTKVLSAAREYAINKMIEEAVQRGANAVIGIDSEASIGGDIMHITIYGTAVLLEPIE